MQNLSNSLPLRMVGILSALILALNFSLEILVITGESSDHQLLLLGLLVLLSLWALSEAMLFRSSSRDEQSERLLMLLGIQFVLECGRAAPLLSPLDLNTLINVNPALHGELFILLPSYVLIFLTISRTLLNIYTGRLDRALQTIKRMEKSALKLTEAIPVGTYVFEVSPEGHGKFTFLSERWVKMLGADRQAVINDARVILDFIHPEDLDVFMAMHKAAMDRRENFLWEGRVLVHGTTRWLKIESIARSLPDHTAVHEGVIIDITTHKEAVEALGRTHEQLTQAAIAASRAEEREHLLQDMHDGFGSQLVSARLLAEHGQLQSKDLADLIQECMADLYLVTDALSSPEATLIDGLADLQYRSEQRFIHLPIAWDWQIDIDSLPPLPHRSILHILRIVQEAVNNAIKHANPSLIKVHAFCSPEGSLEIHISNDGIAMPEQPRKGRGVAGMLQRARQIGAQLEIGSEASGTTVSLRLNPELSQATAS